MNFKDIKMKVCMFTHRFFFLESVAKKNTVKCIIPEVHKICEESETANFFKVSE